MNNIYKKIYNNGREVYYNEYNNIIKIMYPNGKMDIREYYPNGVLKFRIFPNGKCEKYSTDKKLIYRKYNNCEEIWQRDNTGKCIEYIKHVYYNIMEITKQTIDLEDIIQKVITNIFGEDVVFDVSEYNKICDIIEETLKCMQEPKS